MSTLSWNEIENRARLFSSKWEQGHDEKGESQSFWQGFFDVFGIDPKRQGAFFEYRAKKMGDKQGFMDVFWPGKILVEQKSLGKDLDAAIEQANNYLPNIDDELLPQMVVACDFKRFICLDRVTNERHEFVLDQLHNHVKNFGFLIGRSDIRIAEEDPVNRKAAEAMAALHNALRDANYDGHNLEVLLVRLVFCMFADDSGIFENGTFERYLTERTSPDGSDTGPRINMIFQTLDTLEDERQTTLDDEIISLPYINGGLFKETIRTPNFNSEMRTQLLDAMKLDWAKVSPAIFGSMFQGVMDPEARRNLGAHYTSEKNIFKVIDSLFLDELKEEFSKLKPSQKKKLNDFHDKLADLKFLDPACGCGNFLVITYRELRKLEHEVVQKLSGDNTQMVLDLENSIQVNVDQMYGIEIEEFPSLIAETALWLTDHQMNMEASKLFGQHFVRLPLTKRANIVNDNALRIDWKEVVDPSELNYILGNPPFLGHHLQSVEQKEDLRNVLTGIKASGVMDFVSAWYCKAGEYIQENHEISCAFVSTNSITQGEQVGILWSFLIEKYGLIINFAHQTFKWNNDAKGIAAVYCVIIGFGLNKKSSFIYSYADIKAEPVKNIARNINPFLVDAPMVTLTNRSEPICDVPGMKYGNKPTDGGHFLISEEEYAEVQVADPACTQFIKPFVSAKEFLHKNKRYAVWLVDTPPEQIKSSKEIMRRIDEVRKFRLASKAKSTREYPHSTLFRQVTQPYSDYILIPAHSSENRDYIPMGFFTKEYIVGNSCFAIPDATKFHFGILTSEMHMAWVRYTCGRLKSDYRYSKDIVYNNFPWPVDLPEEQKQKAEELAQAILDAREQFPDSSLADLYDPRTMPPILSKAHKALDKYVDSLYRKKPFKDDAERVAHLFEMYAKLTENNS